MVGIYINANPVILKWARERAGLSIEDTAVSLSKNKEDIENWESGIKCPTYNQLEKLAYGLYKIPLAVFFFPEPPQETPPKSAFRTLPEFERDKLSSDTLLAIRELMAKQLALLEITEGEYNQRLNSFKSLIINDSIELATITTKVREILRVPIDLQTSWGNNTIAFKEWRTKVEENGVFVFKRAFKQKDVSGFCLWDNKFPVICINNGNTHARQIFTLFHEFAHLLFQINGITISNDSYIDSLSTDYNRIEVTCNKFAAELLIPTEVFIRQLPKALIDDELILKLANKYRVSREVILRKLKDNRLISDRFFQERLDAIRETYELRGKSKKSGGDYYKTLLTYLGDSFTSLAFSSYYKGRFSSQQLAEYLNIKTKCLAGLEDQFFQKV